ncbi:unknown [Clostridium sp. CAG:306]|nr:unknown [Clostridium sp. CAG:306]
MISLFASDIRFRWFTLIWASLETATLSGRVSIFSAARSTSTASFMFPLMLADCMICCSAIPFIKPKEPEVIVKFDCSNTLFLPRFRVTFSLVTLAFITSLFRWIVPVSSPVSARLYWFVRSIVVGPVRLPPSIWSSKIIWPLFWATSFMVGWFFDEVCTKMAFSTLPWVGSLV